VRGERGTLPGGTGWASHEGTCGRGGSCGGGRLTSALRSSTSMEESSSGSEWICTEAWVDQKAAVEAATSEAARLSKAVAASPPWCLPRLRVPALTTSRPQHVQQPAPGRCQGRWVEGGGRREEVKE
jgi:hypothetical protein